MEKIVLALSDALTTNNLFIAIATALFPQVFSFPYSASFYKKYIYNFYF